MRDADGRPSEIAIPTPIDELTTERDRIHRMITDLLPLPGRPGRSARYGVGPRDHRPGLTRASTLNAGHWRALAMDGSTRQRATSRRGAAGGFTRSR